MKYKQIYAWSSESKAIKLSLTNGNAECKSLLQELNMRAKYYGFAIGISYVICYSISIYAFSILYFVPIIFLVTIIVGKILSKKLIFYKLDIDYVELTINNALKSNGYNFIIKIINNQWHSEISKSAQQGVAPEPVMHQ